MDNFGADRVRDEVILAARILLVVLYLVFGWEKLTNYSATVDDMAQTGAPMPPISALVSIAVELFVSIAIVLGVRTRQLALVLTLYTLATALIGHHFWTMTGTEHSRMRSISTRISALWADSFCSTLPARASTLSMQDLPALLMRNPA